MKIFYTEKQNSDQGVQNLPGIIQSPSSRKPEEVAKQVKERFDFDFVEPEPLTREDFLLAHSPEYVDGILNLTRENGFGSLSQSVVDSLPYTTGAMWDAVRFATPTRPTCALVSGFHHAGYNGWENFGYFCTFNGLVIAARKFGNGVCILDCDMHHGNGTDDIIDQLNLCELDIEHYSLGLYYTNPKSASNYLNLLRQIASYWRIRKPKVIIYQSGADVHVNDPYGGVLTTEQMIERDRIVFTAAKELGIPIAWNLAGGYQVENGSAQKVIDLHLNTFQVVEEIYGNGNA